MDYTVEDIRVVTISVLHRDMMWHYGFLPVPQDAAKSKWVVAELELPTGERFWYAVIETLAASAYSCRRYQVIWTQDAAGKAAKVFFHFTVPDYDNGKEERRCQDRLFETALRKYTK